MSKFVITIGRESGAGGPETARKLSKALGVEYYNRDLLKVASEISGINEQLFGKADENIGMRHILNAAGKVYTGEVLPPDSDDYTSTKNLFAFQAKVIKELAENENCIILGRAGNFLLKGRENVMRVFLHAPLQWRIENVLRDNEGLGRNEIIKTINAEDKRRGDYYHYYTGEDWRDARAYDVSIDVSATGIDETVSRILKLLPVYTDFSEN